MTTHYILGETYTEFGPSHPHYSKYAGQGLMKVAEGELGDSGLYTKIKRLIAGGGYSEIPWPKRDWTYGTDTLLLPPAHVVQHPIFDPLSDIGQLTISASWGVNIHAARGLHEYTLVPGYQDKHKTYDYYKSSVQWDADGLYVWALVKLNPPVGGYSVGWLCVAGPKTDGSAGLEDWVTPTIRPA